MVQFETNSERFRWNRIAFRKSIKWKWNSEISPYFCTSEVIRSLYANSEVDTNWPGNYQYNF